MTVFELASFTVRDGEEEALLAERPMMIAALRQAFPGLLSGWLTKRDDGSWVDVILWDSRESAEQSATHATEVAEAAGWFAHIDEFRGMEHLDVVDDGTVQQP